VIEVDGFAGIVESELAVKGTHPNIIARNGCEPAFPGTA
jgi:hypothetical protein